MAQRSFRRRSSNPALSAGVATPFLTRALAATCYARLVLLELGLEAPLPEQDAPPGIELVRLGPGDEPAYAELARDGTEDDVRVRMRAGAHGFAARRHGRLVAAMWASSGSVAIPYLRATWILEPGTALIQGLYVAPDLRRQGLATLTMAHGLHQLRADGYRRLTSAVLPENAAAFGPPGKLGFRRVGILCSAGIGRRRRCILVSHERLQR